MKTYAPALLAAALAAGLTNAPDAAAAPLPLVGGVASPTGRTVAASPELAGTIIYDQTRTFTLLSGPADDVTLGYDVDLQTRVVRSSVDNTLDFYYRLRNHDTITYPFRSLDALGFEGFAVDADYRTDGLGAVEPVNVLRSVGTGDGVRFQFANGTFLAPDEAGVEADTRFLLIDTLATEFDLGGSTELTAGLIADDPTVRGIANTPRPVVPEPASLLLLATGAAAWVVRRRR